ncbi:MAG: hypothetical protein PHI84_01795 [Kiritimatiellae bacterium]|nr:hypothetical protein [Kiritimatiellia bacterium]
MAGKDVEIPKVVLEIRYKDRNGIWRSTPGITVRELPKAILALQQAYDYLLSKTPSSDTLTEKWNFTQNA